MRNEREDTIDRQLAELSKQVETTEKATEGYPPYSYSSLMLLEKENPEVISSQEMQGGILGSKGHEIDVMLTTAIREARLAEREVGLEQVLAIPQVFREWLPQWMESHEFYKIEGRQGKKVKRRVDGEQHSANRVKDFFEDSYPFFSGIVDTYEKLIQEYVAERESNQVAPFPLLAETNPENLVITEQSFNRKAKLPGGLFKVTSKRDYLIARNDHNEARVDPISIIDVKFGKKFEVADFATIAQVNAYTQFARSDVNWFFENGGEIPFYPAVDNAYSQNIKNVSFYFRHYDSVRKCFEFQYYDVRNAHSIEVLEKLYSMQLSYRARYLEIENIKKIRNDAYVMPYVPADDQKLRVSDLAINQNTMKFVFN